MVYDALAKFDSIYDLQADGRVFDSPEELWGKIYSVCIYPPLDFPVCVFGSWILMTNQFSPLRRWTEYFIF